MKTKTKTKQTKQSPREMLTFYPRLPQQVVSAAFVESLPVQKDGANSHVADFVKIMDSILANKPYFNEEDVFYMARPFFIPQPEVKRLLAQWLAVMVQNCKIEEIQGCMDTPVFLVV